jgi:glycosyltransferase involved in cell wall biosynthesis
MKSALVICFNDLKNDARVMRQISFLKDEYKVTALCFDAKEGSGFEIFRIKKTKLTLIRKAVSSIFLLLGINHIAYYLLHDYKTYIPELRQRSFDLIVANDVEALPLAFQIKTVNTKVFFDAHEFAPRQFEDRLYWRIFFQRFNTALCREYISRVDGMSTINGGLARAYQEQFGINPIIVTNASDYVALTPKPCLQYPIKIVHHGIFTVSRQPDIMIEMMELLDERFTLDLIYLLPGHASAKTRKYFEEFKKKAERQGRIKILPALKNTEIIPKLHERYDIGIILVPPVNFNYENGLPNKLFDCIQARLAMAVGPLREIANITNRYQIGVVSKDFTAAGMANELKSLTPDKVTSFKMNTNRAATELSASFNKQVFLNKLREIFS